MAIHNGQPVDELNSNAAWISKTVDSITVGAITLSNTTHPESGDPVDNIQGAINEIFDVDGIAGEGDPAEKSYSSNNYISNGDDRKVAIGKLDAATAGVQSNLDGHEGQTSNVHGTGPTNEVVGTGTTQTLSNKTFSDAPILEAGQYFGDPTVDNSFQIIDESGSLKFKRRESGSFVEKFQIPDGVCLARKLVSFLSDTDYVTAYGSPTGAEIYYNTTLNKVRVYEAGYGWKNVGAEIVGYQEIPTGAINNSNKDFVLTYAPLSVETIAVYLDRQILPDSLWSYAAGTITLTTAPNFGQEVYVWYLTEGTPAVPVVITGTWHVEYHDVTAGEEVAEAFTMEHTPTSPTKVVCDLIGGDPQ